MRVVERTKLLAVDLAVLEKLRRRYPVIATKLFFNLARNLAAMLQRTESRFMAKMAEDAAQDAYLKAITISEAELVAEVDHILADGVLTDQELRNLEARVYADGKVTAVERAQIDRLNRLVETGRVQHRHTGKPSMLSGLNARQRSVVENHFSVRSYQAGQTVWEGGAAWPVMAAVLVGKVGAELPGGNVPIYVRTALHGELIGEEAVLMNAAEHAEKVVALEDSRLLLIDRGGLGSFMSIHTKLSAQFTYNLVSILSELLQDANRRLYQ